MSNPVFDLDSTNTAPAQNYGQADLAWLTISPPLQPFDELSLLRTHLASLRETDALTDKQWDTLELLYTRSISVAIRLLPTLTDTALPVSRKIRHSARNLQDLLQILAEKMLQTLESHDDYPTQIRCCTNELTLWRILHLLAQHLMISNLIAAPSGIGIWQQLHQAYATAQRLEIIERRPESEKSSLQHIYCTALLLGCGQPASFASYEVSFIAEYIQRFAGHITLFATFPQESTSVFWVDPLHDAPASAYSRKTAAPDTNVFYFSCDRLAELLGKQLAALNAGCTAQQLDLPIFAQTTAGHTALHRLMNYWGHPGKRRFPRRRQNCRAILNSGIDSLWHQFNNVKTIVPGVSSWMITNESPDGYAIMHVSGKTGKLLIGDITAIRIESASEWNICLVRWALSENPEHLELGLQILSSNAISATLALPADSEEDQNSKHLPVLILPEIPPLRLNQTLVIPSGVLHDQHNKLVLIVEQENIEVREVRTTRLDEQTSKIELFSIQSDRRAH